MDNPTGYLYRVDQRKGMRRWKRPVMPAPGPHHDPIIESGLPRASERLPERQRTTVILVHSHAWTREEVADVLGISPSAVRSHVARG